MVWIMPFIIHHGFSDGLPTYNRVCHHYLSPPPTSPPCHNRITATPHRPTNRVNEILCTQTRTHFLFAVPRANNPKLIVFVTGIAGANDT
jgi:hypothetical protein